MDEILNLILKKLEILEKIELDLSAIKNDIKVVKNDIRILDSKNDAISDVVAKIMEDITDIKDRVESQEVEIRVIKGGAALC